VPDGLDADQVAMTATLSHLGLVAFGRNVSSAYAMERALELVHRRFDRATAQIPRRGDLAAVVSTGAALSTLSAARKLDVPSFLDYPVAHHRLSERLLGEERRLTPRFAATLQVSQLSTRVRDRLEQEIEMADRVLLNSTFSLRSFIEAGVPAEKLIVTPFGVDLEMFSPSPDSERGDREQRPFRVLFAGQITQRKGISYLLDAFEQAGLAGSELVFLGRPVGPARSLLDLPGVRFWPAVPITELANRVRACDVFVLPSLIEGFPQTAAIAMACGLPVILSENTSAHDVVADGVNGYVVPIRDAPAIAERLRHLHAHDEVRRAMGRAARERVLSLTWAAYGSRIVDLVRGDAPDPAPSDGFLSVG
jgi:glycosyltransferase involved in cell wall biosynthesis